MVEGFFDVNWPETIEAGDFSTYHQAPAIGGQKTNFDLALVREELRGSDSTIGLSHTDIRPKRCRDVTLVGSDRQLIHHFTTIMVRFCILRNCVHDNLYSYILTNMGLFHRSLFDAMMAWSALHLAHVSHQSDDDARKRYDTAYTELIEDLADDISPALLLTTIWFLMQYQLILAEGVESFCELINLAANVVRGELDGSDPESAMSRIGPIGSLVLVWMSARDNQASYLGYGGKLLGCLKMYPHIYELVDKSSVSDDAPAVVNWIPRPGSKSDGPTDMQACMRLSLRNVTVAGQIKILGRRAGHITPVSSVAWESVHSSLTILHREVEQDESPAAKAALAVAEGSLNAMPTVTAICYNRLLLLGGYYTGLIHYNIYRPHPAIDEPWLLSPEQCADRIIRMCQRVSRERSESPQGIWPTHVFIAGITTKDPVYQSWAVRTLESAEKWGQNIVKTRKLLEAVIHEQNVTGTRVDFLQVMKETTGLFIV